MNLNLSNIADPNVRIALEAVQEALRLEDLLNGSFTFMAFSLPTSVAPHRVYHNLGFVPTDLIITRGEGTWTWHYDQFTKDYLVITVNSDIYMRLFVGKMDA